MTEISRENLVYYKKRHLDEMGTMCKYDGEFIRIIKKSKTNYVKKLMAEDGLIEELMRQDLIPRCWISDMTYEGKMIMCHEKIEPCQQTPLQWSFEMQKAAALLVLKVNDICNSYGYELMDCHQYNVLFSGTVPRYIDVGSIVKKGSGLWRARKEFLMQYYYLLKLWSKGYQRLANSFLATLTTSDYPLYVEVYSSLMGKEEIKDEDFDFREMAEEIAGIENADEKGFWSGYQSDFWENGHVEKRFEKEIEWIKSTDATTMTELGANQGYFSWFVCNNTNIDRIIATDFDRGALDMMYKRFSKDESVKDKVTPLFLDFCLSGDNVIAGMKSDLVVANALVHHLIFTSKMSISVIVERLAMITGKYLIVEFMPRGMANGSRLPKWYNLQWFLDNLSDRFEVIKVEEGIEFGRIQVYAKRR